MEDNTLMVTVPLERYESLIITSERLFIVRDYVQSSEYISKEDIEKLLGIERGMNHDK